MKSKTIILSKENQKGRGILTIYQEDDLLQCRIRLYNMPKLSRFCKIGIYHNGQVYSSNLLNKDDVYTSSMVGDFNIDQDFYSAIIDTENNNNVILSGGTYAGFFFNEQSTIEHNFNLNPQSFQPAEINEDLAIKSSSNNINFEDIEKENPSTNLYSYPNFQSCCNEENERCKNCKYKEFFYSQNNEINKVDNQEISQKAQSENNEKIVETKNILDSLIPQFKYVFENYPEDEILTSLIPNGKFVQINEHENSYSIGAIYEDDEMKYICYAVLSSYNSPAPEELGKHHQWLPIDKEDPLSEGYHIVFQDTSDLKIVEI